MTPAKLQELARDAGLTIDGDGVRSPHLDCVELGDLARFAELVRAAVLEEAARACEREGLEDIPTCGEERAYDRGVEDSVNAVRSLAQHAVSDEGGDSPS